MFSFVLSEVTENKGKLNADESKHRSVLVNLDTDRSIPKWFPLFSLILQLLS